MDLNHNAQIKIHVPSATICLNLPTIPRGSEGSFAMTIFMGASVLINQDFVTQHTAIKSLEKPRAISPQWTNYSRT